MVIDRGLNLKKAYSQALHKYLIQLELSNRRQKRIWLNEQSFRLGRLSTQRQGARVWEFWEEGEAFRKVNSRLREIQQEKEEIERLKKNFKKSGKNSTVSKSEKIKNAASAFGDVFAQPLDIFDSCNNLNSGVGIITENGLDDPDGNGAPHNNNIDINEQKEIYQFKLKIFENEERRLRDDLQTLDKEKILYM